MPAKLDLTARRFGNLIVVREDGKVFWGKNVTAWICECDCGETVRVPQNRLTSNYAGHQYHGCDVCRAKPCIVCGQPVAHNLRARTCSQECNKKLGSMKSLSYYHTVYKNDPSYLDMKNQKRREKWASLTDAEKLEIGRKNRASEGRPVLRARWRDWYHAKMEEPEFRARRAEIRAARAARVDPEVAREYWRRAAQNRRATQAEIETMQMLTKLGGPNESDADQ